MAYRRLILVLGLALVCLAQPQSGNAQAARGAFVAVDTWEASFTTLPSAVWRQPSGIDITPSGRLVVSDASLGRVEVLDHDGTPVRSFGRGSGPEDLASPGHVAVDEARDRVYVADQGAERVAVYSLSGTRTALWPQAAAPAGVAVAPDGRIVVADTDADRVRVFAPDGTEVTNWGGTGKGPAEYDYPSGVHVTSDGVVWVADRGNDRVSATTLDGQPVDVVRISSSELSGAEVLDVAVDGDNLWLATSSGLARFSIGSGVMRGVFRDALATAVALSAAHGMYAVVQPLDDPPGVWYYRYRQASGDPQAKWGGDILVPGYFDGLEAMTIGADNKAYLIDVPPRIQQLALSGSVEQQIEAPDPVEVDADPGGRVYAGAKNKVYAYAPDGTQRWEAEVRNLAPGSEAEIAGIAWDEAGQRLVVLDSGGHRYYYFDELGEPVGDWPLRGSEPRSAYWADMTVDPAGIRYALDPGSGQVRGWDEYNRLVLELDLPVSASRMDVATDGSVYLLSSDGWARRLAADGSVLAQWDATRLDRARDSRPTDITLDDSGRIYVVDGRADVVTVYEWDPDAKPQNPPEVESGCEAGCDKTARPSEVALGDSVEVALTIRGACAPSQMAADIALLIDSSMERSPFRSAILAAERFLDLIDPATDQVAIVAPRGCSLTNDLQHLRRTLRRLEQSDTYIPPLESAEQALFGRNTRTGVKKIMIVLLGGELPDELSWWERYMVERSAGQAKRRGAEIFAIAFGRQADKQLLYNIATSRSHVYQSRGSWQLDEIYRQIAEEVKPVSLLSDLTITDEIPANMEYVIGSADPSAALRGRTLVWHLGRVPLTGTGVRYSLRPLEAGEWPTNVAAWADYTDSNGDPGRLDFPIPVIAVLAPTPIPTATRPTATPRPSATDEPTPTPVAPPTRAPSMLYLPVALKEECLPRHADVALVLDASTSMLDKTATGNTKLSAATEAARLFLDGLMLGSDQAAVVSFNNQALVLQQLTTYRADLDRALESISVETESRIDLGIAAGRNELVSSRRKAGNGAAMIVLTDGRANPSSPIEAVRQAQIAKAAEIMIFTVGLGSDLDFEALREIASRPEYFYHSPDAGDLAAIYASIAREIPCPAEAFWGAR